MNALIKNKAFGFLKLDKYIAGDVPKDLPQTNIFSSEALNVDFIQSYTIKEFLNIIFESGLLFDLIKYPGYSTIIIFISKYDLKSSP